MPTMPGDIFISYARADGSDFVARLHDDLESDGIGVWLDERDILPGEDWDDAIDEALAEARAVIIVLTPAACESVHVRGEWHTALSRFLPIFPILARECEIPRTLAVFQTIDFTEDYDKGLAQLRRALRDLEPRLLEKLRETLAALLAAQAEAEAPQRFDSKIDALRERIRAMEETRADPEAAAQSRRASIDAQLESERHRQADAIEHRRRMRRERVVNSPPLDVTVRFRDRERECEELGRKLADPGARIVVVCGQGGMGKTALACKVLDGLERGEWPHVRDGLRVDGIVYLSTQTTAGISLERVFLDCARMVGGEVEEALLDAWKAPSFGQEAKVERLLDALGDGLYVVLLDNLEDLLDEAGNLTDDELRVLLEAALKRRHGARLLLTTRERPHLPSEGIAGARELPLQEGLPREAAIALLHDLDADGKRGLRDSDAPTLARIWEVTGGVPRALEVFVGIMDEDPFARLDEVIAKFQEHEQTEAMVEDAHRRLDPEARRALEALAIFDAPVPPVAIGYMLAPWLPEAVIEPILRRLARAGFARIARGSGLVGLHPFDRDCAYNRIPEAAEEEGGDKAGGDETKEALARLMRQLGAEPDTSTYDRRSLHRRAADYHQQLEKPRSEWRSIDDLAPQLAEFDQRCRAGDYETACRVLNRIDFEYLFRWGHWRRLRAMRERLLGRLHDRELQGINLGYLGNVYGNLGDYAQAREHYQAALAISREIGDRAGEGVCLGNLGIVYRSLGQYEEAREHYQAALAISREIGDRAGEGVRLGNLGIVYHNLGDYAQAREHHQAALAISRDIGDRAGEGRHLGNLGIVYRTLGQYEEAREHHQAALAIAREIGDRAGEGADLGNLSGIHQSLGEFDRAWEHCDAAHRIARDIGEKRLQGYTCFGLARAHQKLGNAGEALAFAAQSADIFQALGAPEVAPADGLRDALRAADSGDRAGEARGLLACAGGLADTGDCRKALEVARDALSAAQAANLPDLAAQAGAIIDRVSETITKGGGAP